MAFIDKELLTINDEKSKLSLFSLALPLFFGSISTNLIALVQTIMSAYYANGYYVIPTSLSALPVNVIMQVLLLVASGTTILLSVLIGRKDEEKCRKLIGTALISTIALCVIVLAVALIFAEPIMYAVALQNSQYSAYATDAITYFRYRMVAIFVVVVRELFLGVLRCYGKTHIGLIVALTANLTNAGLVALCMFVLPIPTNYAVHFLGVVGMIAPTLGGVVVLIALKKYKIKIDCHFSFKTLKEIIKVGAPASISSVSYSLSSTITTIICISLSPVSYLAKTYVSQIVTFSNMFGYSIGQASSIMIGRCCGLCDYDKANQIHPQNLRLILMSNGALSLLFALLSRPMAILFYSPGEEVVALMSVIMWIDIAVELARGLNHIGQFGLNATGDVLFTTVVSIVGCWVFSVGLAYLFVAVFNWGLYGIWIAFIVDEFSRGISYLFRWKSGKWRGHFAVK
ncbi:MAG: hypothetical protein IKC64_06205 [Clostridia bacterium]|nr:hypothetical protein [Clostridia bacterium]